MIAITEIDRIRSKGMDHISTDDLETIFAYVDGLQHHSSPHKYPTGTQFNTRGKHPKLCTVTDTLTTYNSDGDIVALRYVATHEGFNRQVITDRDVLETTITMGLIERG